MLKQYWLNVYLKDNNEIGCFFDTKKSMDMAYKKFMEFMNSNTLSDTIKIGDGDCVNKNQVLFVQRILIDVFPMKGE